MDLCRDASLAEVVRTVTTLYMTVGDKIYYNQLKIIEETKEGCVPLTIRSGRNLIRGTQRTCNRLKFSVREMSSRAFLINAFCFRRDKNDVLETTVPLECPNR